MTKHIILRFLASFMLIAVMSGCASTETSRSTGETLDDATITSKVKTELIQEESLGAFQIDVDTYRGVVQLNGFVDTPENAEKAARVAKEVSGVTSVKNNLQIKPAPAPAG